MVSLRAEICTLETRMKMRTPEQSAATFGPKFTERLRPARNVTALHTC
jgi:hypothetical protein